MLLEAKASVTGSLTDISVVILPDSHRTFRADEPDCLSNSGGLQIDVDEF